MGTRWTARVVDPRPDCQTRIEAVLARVIAQMSTWEPASDICRFNRHPLGHWMPLPPEMMFVIQAGLELADITGGAFDPAIGHMVDTWGFGAQTVSCARAEKRAEVPWRGIETNGSGARRLADVALDLSGIAKGFAVDAVAQSLSAVGLTDFLIEIGGELRARGLKPDMQPWWVDVETPSGLDIPVLRVALCGQSIATSGDYRRFHMAEGQRLSHSIIPARGRPIDNDVAAVTVLHESAMWADAWATAITVMGPERGMALATRQGLAARLVRRGGSGPREYMTPALATMLD